MLDTCMGEVCNDGGEETHKALNSFCNVGIEIC